MVLYSHVSLSRDLSKASQKRQKNKNEALFSYINDVSVDLNVACSRLRDSRVRWTEKARTWKKKKNKNKKRKRKKEKKKGNWGEEGPPVSRTRPANFSRAFHFRVLPTNRLI